MKELLMLARVNVQISREQANTGGTNWDYGTMSVRKNAAQNHGAA
jgi:hypothetical protein